MRWPLTDCTPAMSDPARHRQLRPASSRASDPRFLVWPAPVSGLEAEVISKDLKKTSTDLVQHIGPFGLRGGCISVLYKFVTPGMFFASEGQPNCALATTWTWTMWTRVLSTKMHTLHVAVWSPCL